MNKSVVKLHSKVVSKPGIRQVTVTKQQLRILELIYKFRFVSTAQLQFVLGKKQIQQIQQRLNLMLERQWIGRNFSKLDRLTGKYASYFLLPGGMKILKAQAAKTGKELDKRLLHNIYKDKTASERHITHCMAVGDIYCDLRRIYGETMQYFTKSLLTSYDYCPVPRADAFLRLAETTLPKSKKHEFFLDYCEEAVPFFAYRNRIKYYEEYDDEDTWSDAAHTKLPTVLLVAESPRLQRRLLRFLKKYLEGVYSDDLKFLVTNKELLTGAKPDSTIWSEVDDELETIVLSAIP